MDEARVIGGDGTLLWHYPEDLKRFSELTRGGVVLMGRTTYESLPPKFKPLPGRRNVVVSRTLTEAPAPGVSIFSSIPEALESLSQEGVPEVWIIGGAQIYQATSELWDELYLTRVPGTHTGDVFFPPFESFAELVSQEKGVAGVLFERYRCL